MHWMMIGNGSRPTNSSSELRMAFSRCSRKAFWNS
jgi:hypothetical protein